MVFVDISALRVFITLSLHDALPICGTDACGSGICACMVVTAKQTMSRATRKVVIGILSSDKGRTSSAWSRAQDRKSTRLNSSHVEISYAVFCLKKKTKHKSHQPLIA